MSWTRPRRRPAGDRARTVAEGPEGPGEHAPTSSMVRGPAFVGARRVSSMRRRNRERGWRRSVAGARERWREIRSWTHGGVFNCGFQICVQRDGSCSGAEAPHLSAQCEDLRPTRSSDFVESLPHAVGA